MAFRISLLRAGLLPAILLACSGPAVPPARVVSLDIVTAVTPDGRATEDWFRVLRLRLSPPEFDSVHPLIRPLTADQSGWDSLVRSRRAAWEAMALPLMGLYAPAAPPPRVRIVMGNRGTEDAFTAGPGTIGFDLSSLVLVYGSAHDQANIDRIDRFFRHEFNHILQKAWLSAHPWKTSRSIDYALFDVWAEGLGNYYSLSDRWVTSDGKLTEMGRRTLEDLEPRFVERFTALACADSGSAGPLLKGLSSGPFGKKWGAVSAALWLATEPAPVDSALRRLILAGPAGVWDLAERHLSGTLKVAIGEARSAGSRCSENLSPAD